LLKTISFNNILVKVLFQVKMIAHADYFYDKWYFFIFMLIIIVFSESAVAD